MKQSFGYLLLIFSALMLLSLIGGISLWFESVSNTWTVTQTDIIARNFAQVLWYGGIVFVSVLGYGLFTTLSKGGHRSHNQQTQPQQTHGLQVIDQPYINHTLMGALPPPGEDVEWYAIEQPTNHVVSR